MQRAVILEFQDEHFRHNFIQALKLEDYTLHQKKPILYCRLSKADIETAVKQFDAKDTSYQSSGDLFDGFLDNIV